MFRSMFSFLSRGIILWIELPWLENPVNTYIWHTETLDTCFDLIRSHQLYIPMISTTGYWTSDHRVLALQSVVAGGDHSIHCWWDLIRSKQLFSVSVCCAWVFAGFSGHGNSIHCHVQDLSLDCWIYFLWQ